jgi:hypothetical protein
LAAANGNVELDEIAVEAYQRGISVYGVQPAEPLWSAPYNEDSWQSLYRFLRECVWTLNEADGGLIETIPDLPFLRYLAYRWWHCRRDAKELIIQKSRRIVVSWTLAGCETWAMGLAKQNFVVTGLNYDKAAKHAWRYVFILTQLAKRRPEVYKGGHEGTRWQLHGRRLRIGSVSKWKPA